MSVKNYLRSASENLYIATREFQEELPFPMKLIQVGDDQCVVYYDIPEEKMQWALNHSSHRRLSMETEMFDMFAEKKFKWKDAIILRHKNVNIVASPYFVESGEICLDVVPYRRGIKGWGFPNIVK